MNAASLRAVKAIIGIVLLVILVVVVSGWLGQYRRQSAAVKAKAAASAEASKAAGESEKKGSDSKPSSNTAKSTSKDSSTRKTLVVLTDGLNFRKTAERDGDPIRGLDRGEKVTLIKSQESWYYVVDKNGVKGWISANPSYSRLEK